MPSQLDALRRRLDAPAQAPTPIDGAGMHTLVVAGGKGGVGTSVIAALLALAAFERGERVLLVDADDQVGPLATLMGCIAPDVRLDDLLRGLRPPRDVLAWLDPRFALLPGGVPLARELPALSGAERRVAFRRLTSAGMAFDRVIIDAGARADGVLASCAAAASALLVVTAPDAVANAAAFAIAKAVSRQHPQLMLAALANRTDTDEGGALLAHLADGCARFLERDIALLGTTPVDDVLDRALRAGIPLVDASRGSPAALSVANALQSWLSAARDYASAPVRRAS
jgi:MinD-like ATPase involved in chromosome partitioning or flagellar assembly